MKINGIMCEVLSFG